MKKLLLSLGALSAVVAPVAAVVACGSDSKDPVTPATVDAKTLESNEVWNQTPGTRVFHVGFKIDGAAKHKTAGTVVALDPADKGSYGFHGLFGFLKHATKTTTEGTMFAVGDKVVLNVDGTKEYNYTFDAAGVKIYTDLLADLQNLDASQFSALNANKHPGTALIQTAITTGVSIQTKALNDLLGLLNVNDVDTKTVQDWAAPHAINGVSFTVTPASGTAMQLATLMEFGHTLFKGHVAPAVGTVLKINGLKSGKTYTYTVKATDPWSLVGYVNGESHQADFLLDLAAQVQMTPEDKTQFIGIIGPLLKVGPNHQTVNANGEVSAEFKKDAEEFRSSAAGVSANAINRVKAAIKVAEDAHNAAKAKEAAAAGTATTAVKVSFTINGVAKDSVQGFGHALFNPATIAADDKLQIIVGSKTYDYTVKATDVTTWKAEVSSSDGQVDFFEDLATKAKVTTEDKAKLMKFVGDALSKYSSHQQVTS